MTPAEFRRFTIGAYQREKASWRRTAQLIATIQNVNRGRKRAPTRPNQIAPWAFAPDPEE